MLFSMKTTEHWKILSKSTFQNSRNQPKACNNLGSIYSRKNLYFHKNSVLLHLNLLYSHSYPPDTVVALENNSPAITLKTSSLANTLEARVGLEIFQNPIPGNCFLTSLAIPWKIPHLGFVIFDLT